MILIHHRQTSTVGVRAHGRSSTANAQLVRINPVYAALLRVFGPAECGDNPLAGTKYDAVLAGQRDRERFERRAARIPRRQRRLHPTGAGSSWSSSDRAARPHP